MSGWKARRYRPRNRPKSKICGHFRYFGSVRCLDMRQLLTMISRPNAKMTAPFHVRKRGPWRSVCFESVRRKPAAPVATPQTRQPAAVADAASASDADSAREILELLELELGAMIRQLERAANSVAGGAEATAATLSTIRQRTDALTGRTSAAQIDRDHLLAGRRQIHPFGRRHRLPGARRRASSPIRPAPPRAKPAPMWIGCANPRPRSAMSST